jgi:hypothetical protein
MQDALRNFVLKFLRLVVALALSIGTVWAQGGTGELTGLVTDPSGAVVSGIQIALTNSATASKRITTTTGAGTYRFTALPVVGTYTLDLIPKGFKGVKIAGIVITVGTVTTHDVKLELGAASEQVTVEAGAQLVQSVDASVSQLIDRRVWESIPLETRSQNELINLVAGAEPEAFNPTARGASVNGARSGTGNYLVEGADNNQQGQGGVALQGPGGANTTISPDAIQEYRVITNGFPAEYGKAGGFVTDTVLKGGTNNWHGSAFEYNRNQAITANDFFSDRGHTRDHLVRNQFGGSLGGPVIKDKTFFYGTGELHRLRQSTPLTGTTVTRQFLDFVKNGSFEKFIESDPNGLCASPTLGIGAPCPAGSFRGSATLGPMFQKLIASEPGALPLAQATVACNPAAGATRNDPNCVGAGFYTAGLVYPVQVYGTTTKEIVSATDQSRFSIKFDHKLSTKDQVNVVYLFDDVQSTDNNNGGVYGQTGFGVGEVVPSRAQNATFSWNRILSNRVLNQARVGYVRRVANFTAPGVSGVPEIITFDPIIAALGAYNGIPQFFTENQFQYKDDLSLTKGKHNFKTGFEYRRTRNGSSFFSDKSGTLELWGVEDLVTDAQFTDNADFALIGVPFAGACAVCSSSINPQTGVLPDYYRGYRANEYAAYLQDDWRLSSRLTLNLGMRWDYFGPPHNFRSNTDSNFYTGAATPLAASNNPFFPANNPYYEKIGNGSMQIRNHDIWNKDLENFEPRLGFAWDLFGTQKLVVRGGAGLMYDRIYNNLFENIRFNPPLFSDATFGFLGNGVPAGALDTPNFNQFYAVPFTANQTGFMISRTIFPRGLPQASPRAMDQNLVTPYYEQMHFGAQYEFGKDLVLETNYIGTLGRKLTGIVNTNTFDGRLLAGVSHLRPNPTVSSINFRTNGFESNYHGVQFSLRKRYANGLQFSANYTYSKALDEISDAFHAKQNGGDFRPTDQENVHLDYGPADFDVRHRGVVSYNYDLPFMKSNRWLGGWQVNGIFSYQTGNPINILDTAGSYDLNKDGGLNDRATYIAGFNAHNVILSTNPADGFLNPAAFTGTAGNPVYTCPLTVNGGNWCNSPMHRNDIYGPHYVNLDFGLGKAFQITETSKLTFFANFFNIFNHPNMYTPDGSVTDPAFGKSQQTIGNDGTSNGHRIGQLALRFDF